MRYTIGCTYIDQFTKKVSAPYLVCINQDYKIVFNVNSIKYLINESIFVLSSNNVDKVLKYLRKKYCGYNFYPLKIDSLNFPYKLTLYSDYYQIGNNQCADICKIVGTKSS